MSLARRNQKVGSPGCIELSVCAVRTTDDYVRVPPLNLPVLPVAHCSRPIVNDPAIHTHVQGESEPPKKLAASCHLPSALTPAPASTSAPGFDFCPGHSRRFRAYSCFVILSMRRHYGHCLSARCPPSSFPGLLLPVSFSAPLVSSPVCAD